ncbi:seryl-tRNA synthetase [Buchnera aphidicola (Cinara tujafilina)]|uniref:Serine--tRNA ligase n=1 Tax=Buchnera aphidicola (Cinara tujafilina) TaxID=261317 RepID=F7WZC6_9GAMM|nr:serine--tRNA ligase [Buchnera aphidicola]AEH39788.1 seryl-tRNA synthetase [Buchnera aphidicola (Cinara tujafilina)]
MLDFNSMKHNYQYFYEQLKRRNFFLDIKKISKLENKRKKLQSDSESLQSEHKKLSQYILYKSKIYNNIDIFKNQLIASRNRLSVWKKKLKSIRDQMNFFLDQIPNIPSLDSPDGKNEKDNREVSLWGNIKKYNFSISNHIHIGQKIHGFDWKIASLISGSGYTVIKGKLAKLHRALGQFMLDIHIEKHGYQEVYVPNIVQEHCMYGTGQLPKFEKELFYVNTYHDDNKKINQKKYFLIPTAEVPLINLMQNKIILSKFLPIKYVSLSACFRAESAAYGKNKQGLIRNHQFEKVEIIQIVHPDKSEESFENLTKDAEHILKLLKLPYRKILLCTGDLGFSAKKTYDLEAWFPAQNCYREISSCSMIGDFQSRRIKARYRDEKKKKINFLHTLNGSGLAVGRTLAAILENFQCSDNKIIIPKVLRNPYMNGIKTLKF